MRDVSITYRSEAEGALASVLAMICPLSESLGVSPYVAPTSFYFGIAILITADGFMVTTYLRQGGSDHVA